MLTPPTTPASVRLDHARPELARVTVVDWCLGTACNYACSYCPPRLHDGRLAWPELDVAARFAARVARHYAALGRDVFFQFSGGEPTVWRDFLALARHVRGLGGRAGVISNASRTLRWWDEALGALDQAVLTHHVDHADLDHFVAVAALCGRRVRTHVNVTMPPDRFDVCLAHARRIAAECADVTITLKPMLVDFGAELYPYTPGQRRVLADVRLGGRTTRPVAEVRGAMRVTYADGRTADRRAGELIVAGENRWAGWSCQAGVELLSVDAGGRVYRGVCKQGGSVGHIADEALALPTSPVVCTRATCHCATDVMTTRWRA